MGLEHGLVFIGAVCSTGTLQEEGPAGRGGSGVGTGHGEVEFRLSTAGLRIMHSSHSTCSQDAWVRRTFNGKGRRR